MKRHTGTWLSAGRVEVSRFCVAVNADSRGHGSGGPEGEAQQTISCRLRFSDRRSRARGSGRG
jgi:hypothetical protein